MAHKTESSKSDRNALFSTSSSSFIMSNVEEEEDQLDSSPKVKINIVYSNLGRPGGAEDVDDEVEDSPPSVELVKSDLSITSDEMQNEEKNTTKSATVVEEPPPSIAVDETEQIIETEEWSTTMWVALAVVLLSILYALGLI